MKRDGRQRHGKRREQKGGRERGTGDKRGPEEGEETDKQKRGG